MYHPNQSPSARRAGEDFLRRMAQTDLQEQKCAAPFLQQNTASGCCNMPKHQDCVPSTNPQMPALAMVYAPVQSWTCLMDSSEEALANGTLFKELFLPFEGNGIRRPSKNMGRC